MTFTAKPRLKRFTLLAETQLIYTSFKRISSPFVSTIPTIYPIAVTSKTGSPTSIACSNSSFIMKPPYFIFICIPDFNFIQKKTDPSLLGSAVFFIWYFFF
ncbi:hypothetical protein F2382_01174 [Listeria monocytogenes]|nr:hypothetical protein F2382_01174 [Listeria monocytogenes]